MNQHFVSGKEGDSFSLFYMVSTGVPQRLEVTWRLEAGILWRLIPMPDRWMLAGQLGTQPGPWLPTARQLGSENQKHPQRARQKCGLFGPNLRSHRTYSLHALLPITVIKFYLFRRKAHELQTQESWCHTVKCWGITCHDGHLWIVLSATVAILATRVHIPSTYKVHSTPVPRVLSLLPLWYSLTVWASSHHSALSVVEARGSPQIQLMSRVLKNYELKRQVIYSV